MQNVTYTKCTIRNVTIRKCTIRNITGPLMKDNNILELKK